LIESIVAGERRNEFAATPRSRFGTTAIHDEQARNYRVVKAMNSRETGEDVDSAARSEIHAAGDDDRIKHEDSRDDRIKRAAEEDDRIKRAAEEDDRIKRAAEEDDRIKRAAASLRIGREIDLDGIAATIGPDRSDTDINDNDRSVSPTPDQASSTENASEAREGFPSAKASGSSEFASESSRSSDHTTDAGRATIAAEIPEIDAKIKDRLRRALLDSMKSGTKFSIEEMAANTPEPHRSTLLRELKRLEQEYRAKFDRARNEGTIAATIADDLSALKRNDISSDPGATIDAENFNRARTISESQIDDSILFLVHQYQEKLREAEGPAVKAVRGYEILEELGRGGMGVVYKARQKGLNRLTALKMVLAGVHAGDERLARFQIEAEAVAHLRHPHIVQIYEVGEQDGLPFFSLEYVDGGSLAEKLDGKPRPPIDAAIIVEKLARAMAAAHQEGIIHRDLKPANVLLMKSGEPKITDFGLAKRLESDSSQTRSGTLMGTPSYMAPEQARGDVHAMGPLSDQYSLGAILYEALTGRPPFQGTTMLETLEQVRSQEPVPPSRLQPKIPRDIETICLKCLQKDPKRRYATTIALAEDLERFINRRPIEARPVTFMEKGWRWCRRNPRVAGLYAAVGGLAAAIAVAAGSIALRSARDAELIEQTRRNQLARIALATRTMAEGDPHRAFDIVDFVDPIVRSRPALADVRDRVERLRGRIELFNALMKLIDESRYYAYIKTSGKTDPAAAAKCDEMVQLYDEIERGSRRGAVGLPDLDDKHKQLFKEDVFDGLLAAAIVAWDAGFESAKAGEKNIESGRRALALLDKAERILPETKALYVRRGGIREQIGDAKGAAADFARAAAIPVVTPVDLYYHAFADTLRAREEAKKKNRSVAIVTDYFQKAESGYAAMLRERPESFWGYFMWAQQHAELGDPMVALVGYTTCVRIAPDRPWPYHDRGVVFKALKQYEPAIRDFAAAIERDPKYVSAFINRAETYAATGKTTEAIRDYTSAIGLDAKNANLYFKRANLAFLMKDYQAARDDFSKARRLAPSAAGPIRSLALSNLMLKDLDASLNVWRELAALQPKNPEPPYYQGVIEFGRLKFDEALRSLDRSIELKPDQPLARLARARIYYLRGEFDRALGEINVVLNVIDESNAWYINDRADVYRAMGKIDLALADCRKAIELASRSKADKSQVALIDACVLISLIERSRGDSAAAAAALDRMVELSETSAAYLRRGEFLSDSGRFDRAYADCDRAAEIEKKANETSILPALLKTSIRAAQGEVVEATAEADRLIKTAKIPDGRALVAAAQTFGIAAKSINSTNNHNKSSQTSYADRGAELLALALTKGFHDLDYQELERILEDPALAAIRDRPAVAELLVRRPKK
jgi:serine/threonine protein kinase/predicted Zn-dependent protease